MCVISAATFSVFAMDCVDTVQALEHNVLCMDPDACMHVCHMN